MMSDMRFCQTGKSFGQSDRASSIQLAYPAAAQESVAGGRAAPRLSRGRVAAAYTWRYTHPERYNNEDNNENSARQ